MAANNMLICEKRELPRRELIYYLKVNDLLTSQELGRLVDIHTKGILLIGHDCLNIGQDYLISIEPPKILTDQGHVQIGTKARCVWVHPSQARPFNESGLMFQEMSDEARRSINLLIELFALPDFNFKA
jgi:hypothetical protein